MHRYKELEIWKRSVKLSGAIYELTASFPQDEKFGLTSQIRRSAVSVASNIAEGAGRAGKKDFMKFLDYAYGSLCELETQCIIGKDLGFIDEQDLKEIAGEIIELQKMTYSFRKKLK